MSFLHGFGVAIVREDASIKHTAKDEPFLETVVEFEQREARSGKTHSQRVVFRSFNPVDIERVPTVRKGAIIGIEGNVDGVATQRDGRVYANPRVTGRIMHIAEVGA